MFAKVFSAALIASVALSATATPIAARAAGAGTCGSPAIELVASGKEQRFQAVNQADFNHGGALAIGVISDFICGQISSKCKGSAAEVSTCDAASTAAKGTAGGKTQAAADAFNTAIGA